MVKQRFIVRGNIQTKILKRIILLIYFIISVESNYADVYYTNNVFGLNGFD